MARDVRIAILGDSRDFSRAVKTAGTDAKGLGSDLNKAGSHFQSFAKHLAIGAGAVAIAGAVLAKGFVDAALESQKVTKQTEAVIKSMGGASKVTAKEVAKLSTKLSLKTGVDDELIQSGQNLLLTFGKIRNEVGKDNKIFDRATEAALNMSVALGTDMKGASIQIGKALNDPIKGITALTRAGVSFTEQQKDQIRWMANAGDTLGAQKIILAELENQFGGSAEAQATAVDKIKVAWGNIQEELGAELLPVVEHVAEWLSLHLPGAMETLRGWIDDTLKPALEDVKVWFEEKVLPPMQAVADFVKDTLIPRLGDIVTWMTNSEPAMTAFGVLVGTYLVGALAAYAVAAWNAFAATVAATWPFWLFVAAVAALTTVLYNLTNKEGEGFLDWLQRVADNVAGVVDSVVGFLISVWTWATLAFGVLKEVVKIIKELATAPFPDLPGLPRGSNGGVPVIPGWAEDMLPFMDNGGIMPGPRGVHSLALVAGGETVLPTHKSGFSGGGDININIGGDVTDGRLRELIYQQKKLRAVPLEMAS